MVLHQDIRILCTCEVCYLISTNGSAQTAQSIHAVSTVDLFELMVFIAQDKIQKLQKLKLVLYVVLWNVHSGINISYLN